MTTTMVALNGRTGSEFETEVLGSVLAARSFPRLRSVEGSRCVTDPNQPRAELGRVFGDEVAVDPVDHRRVTVTRPAGELDSSTTPAAIHIEIPV